jgi:hypothetical protein
MAGNQSSNLAKGCIPCLAILSLLLFLSQFAVVPDLEFRVERAEKWEDPSFWKEVSCDVLAVGVECADTEGKSCKSYPNGNMPEGNPPVFGDGDSLCPGTYRCARQGESCSCTGEVVFAPELFDGDNYVVETPQSVFTVTSVSSIMCDLNPSGAFSTDPDPSREKFCWCTPTAIMSHTQNLHKVQCARLSNEDLEVSIDAAASSRRLHAVNTTDRRLGASVYTHVPWALVRVNDDQQSVACAYEHGAPLASFMDFQSSGVGEGPMHGAKVAAAQRLATGWAETTGRSCWIRTAGRSASMNCAIALAAPGALEHKRQDQLAFTRALMYGSLACALIFTGVSVYLIMRDSNRATYEEMGDVASSE